MPGRPLRSEVNAITPPPLALNGGRKVAVGVTVGGTSVAVEGAGVCAGTDGVAVGNRATEGWGPTQPAARSTTKASQITDAWCLIFSSPVSCPQGVHDRGLGECPGHGEGVAPGLPSDLGLRCQAEACEPSSTLRQAGRRFKTAWRPSPTESPTARCRETPPRVRRGTGISGAAEVAVAECYPIAGGIGGASAAPGALPAGAGATTCSRLHAGAYGLPSRVLCCRTPHGLRFPWQHLVPCSALPRPFRFEAEVDMRRGMPEKPAPIMTSLVWPFCPPGQPQRVVSQRAY